MKSKIATCAAVVFSGLISATTMATANLANFYDPAENEVVTIRVGSTPAPVVIVPHNNGIPLEH